MELRARRPSRNGHAGPAGDFDRQIDDFARAVEQKRAPFVEAASAIAALRVIERAYSIRKRMAQPWVDAGAPPS
jgi:predicted dehydrogenase